MTAAVVKVGGSLSRGRHLLALCRQLAELGGGYHLLIVPGGGDFADVVRSFDRRYQLTAATAHWMAILAMDQYGYLLSDLIPGSVPVASLAAAHQVTQTGKVPVLLPFRLFQKADPLPHSWAVTSDSIAAWVAEAVGAPLLVLLKDVDGLFSSTPARKAGAVLLEEITLDGLAGCEGVDRYFTALLRKSRLDVWVINGTYPERLMQLLAEGWTTGTHVQRSTP